MPAEERDVPPLDVLLNDVTEMQARFDDQAKSAPDAEARSQLAVSFIQNDMLPWLKDFVESTLYGFEDTLPPVEIPATEAENIVEILEATKQSNAGNTLLVERIDRALSFVKEDEDDAEDEDEEETTN